MFLNSTHVKIGDVLEIEAFVKILDFQDESYI